MRAVAPACSQHPPALSTEPRVVHECLSAQDQKSRSVAGEGDTIPPAHSGFGVRKPTVIAKLQECVGRPQECQGRGSWRDSRDARVQGFFMPCLWSSESWL